MIKKVVIKTGIIFFLIYGFLSLLTLMFFSAWAPESVFKSAMWYIMRRPEFLKYISGEESFVLYMPLNILFWTAIACMITFLIAYIVKKLKKI